MTTGSNRQARRIHDEIQHLQRSTDQALRDEWDRSLPFADALLDRWERARSLGFGEGTSAYDSAAFFGSVTIGDATYIGSQSMVSPSVTIGDRCIIGANSFVNTDVSDRTVVAGSPARPIGRVVDDGAATHIERINDTRSQSRDTP